MLIVHLFSPLIKTKSLFSGPFPQLKPTEIHGSTHYTAQNIIMKRLLRLKASKYFQTEVLDHQQALLQQQQSEMRTHSYIYYANHPASTDVRIQFSVCCRVKARTRGGLAGFLKLSPLITLTQQSFGNKEPESGHKAQ